VKVISSDSTNKRGRKQGLKDSYRSWDPLTQSKFLFDLHRELGNPISQAESYRLALSAVNVQDVAFAEKNSRAVIELGTTP